MTNDKNVQTWPDLAIGLYDKLTGRGAEITYEFENLKVGVPQDSADTSAKAQWTLDGAVKIRTTDKKGA